MYVLLDQNKQPLYVGEAVQLADRLAEAARSPFWQDQGAGAVRSIADVNSPYALQSQLVTRLAPRLNAAILAAEVAEEVS